MTKITATLVCWTVVSCGSPVLLSGCGGAAGPDRYKVTGTVTLDGDPLESGRINFLSEDGGGDGGEIKDGNFTVQATPGKKRVQITASRVSDKPVEGKSNIMQMEDIVPDRYNSKSTLTAEISGSEPNEVSFELESVP